MPSKCEACGMTHHLETHHIVTRGAGGHDAEWNYLHLCRACHHDFHSWGWQTFAECYDHLSGKIQFARAEQGKRT